MRAGLKASPTLALMREEIAQLRAIVAALPPAAEGMGPYLAKVRERAYTVTDADVERLKSDGFSEDEIFEQTVAVAIAQGLRRFDAAMAVIG
jgi:alkylhydroperoxidase family enzyme